MLRQPCRIGASRVLSRKHRIDEVVAVMNARVDAARIQVRDEFFAIIDQDLIQVARRETSCRRRHCCDFRAPCETLVVKSCDLPAARIVRIKMRQLRQPDRGHDRIAVILVADGFHLVLPLVGRRIGRSRVRILVDSEPALPARQRIEALKGKVAIANAKLAYQHYLKVIRSERWKKLAAKGARLALSDVNAAGLEETMKSLPSGTEARSYMLDVAKREAVFNHADEVKRDFGTAHFVINNAGVSAQALLEDVKTEDLGWYEQLMRVNHWGAVWCTHAALPHLKAARGQIVAVSSLAGLVGVPGRTAYSATKFAMTGFFEALRAELKGAGISVTTAYPGVVATQIRYRGYNAAGVAAGSSGLKEDDAMSVAECARLILEGMDRREREVVMTAKGKLGRLLKIIAPGLVEKMALAALKDEVKPH